MWRTVSVCLGPTHWRDTVVGHTRRAGDAGYLGTWTALATMPRYAITLPRQSLGLAYLAITACWLGLPFHADEVSAPMLAAALFQKALAALMGATVLSLFVLSPEKKFSLWGRLCCLRSDPTEGRDEIIDIASSLARPAARAH